MTDTELDFESAYKVAGHEGIAWRLEGYATETVVIVNDEEDEELYWVDYEEVEDRTRIKAHMIGDDRTWTFDVTDLTPLSEGDYCLDCGQIGCGWHT